MGGREGERGGDGREEGGNDMIVAIVGLGLNPITYS